MRGQSPKGPTGKSAVSAISSAKKRRDQFLPDPQVQLFLGQPAHLDERCLDRLSARSRSALNARMQA